MQQVWISINDDDIDEPDQTFGIEISTSSPSDAYIADSQGQATIIDNDAPPTIYIYDAYAYEWDGVIEFYVYLSNPSEKGVSFEFATADGTALAGEDYEADSGTYTFTGTSGSILIGVVDDSVQEDDEQFTLNLSNPTNGTLDGLTFVSGNIYDDDYLEPLTLDLPAATDSTAPPLTQSQVAPLAVEAARRWSLTGAESSDLRTLLATVDIRIVDLPGSQLGAAGRNRILLDVDAAGYGWFVDSSPRDDREFQKIIGGGELQATGDSAAVGHVDLFTVITHEFGHLLGHGDLPVGLFPHHIMTETLGLGTRRTTDSVSHRLDPYLPNQQRPHLYFDAIRTSLLAHSSSSKDTQRMLDALDTVLAEENAQWGGLNDVFMSREQLDPIFQTLGAAD